MQSFEVVVSVFEDGTEDVTHMFGEASGLSGMMECFNTVVNTFVGSTCRVELRYNNRVVMAFETDADVVRRVISVENVGGGRNAQQS